MNAGMKKKMSFVRKELSRIVTASSKRKMRIATSCDPHFEKACHAGS